MTDLLIELKENDFSETEEKGVFIRRLYGDYYLAKILVFNNAIHYYKIVNDSELFEVEFHGDKLNLNLKEISKDAYYLCNRIQSRIIGKRLTIDKIKLEVKEEFPDWAFFY